FHAPAPTAIYTLSLHDALPILLSMLVRHVPTFYRENELPDPDARECRAADCLRLMSDIWNTYENGLPWGQRFTQDQLNGYLQREDRKSTRLNSSHVAISYAVFC